jgi:surface antigen
MRSRAIEDYKATLELSSVQREALVGLLLGDACLETQNRGRTYRLKIEQTARRQAYVEHLYSLFQEWVLTPPSARIKRASNGSVTENLAFQTVSHSAFRFYAQQFYVGGRKRVPELIHHWLTPRGLSYWFMDDGSLKSSQSKGVILNTHCFSLQEVERLATCLSDYFGLQVAPRRQPDGVQLYVSGRSFETFSALVEPYIIPEMRYKVPQARRTTCRDTNLGRSGGNVRGKPGCMLESPSRGKDRIRVTSDRLASAVAGATRPYHQGQ